MSFVGGDRGSVLGKRAAPTAEPAAARKRVLVLPFAAREVMRTLASASKSLQAAPPSRPVTTQPPPPPRAPPLPPPPQTRKIRITSGATTLSALIAAPADIVANAVAPRLVLRRVARAATLGEVLASRRVVVHTDATDGDNPTRKPRVPLPSVMPRGAAVGGGKRLRVLTASAVQSATRAVLAVEASVRRTGTNGRQRVLSTRSLTVRAHSSTLAGVEVPASFASSATTQSSMSFGAIVRERTAAAGNSARATARAPSPAVATAPVAATTAALLSGTTRRRIIVSRSVPPPAAASAAPKPAATSVASTTATGRVRLYASALLLSHLLPPASLQPHRDIAQAHTAGNSSAPAPTRPHTQPEPASQPVAPSPRSIANERAPPLAATTVRRPSAGASGFARALLAVRAQQ